MVPRLVPEISSLDAFCDTAGAAVGIGDSRSWMQLNATHPTQQNTLQLTQLIRRYSCSGSYFRGFPLECVASSKNELAPFAPLSRIHNSEIKRQIWFQIPHYDPPNARRTYPVGQPHHIQRLTRAKWRRGRALGGSVKTLFQQKNKPAPPCNPDLKAFFVWTSLGGHTT